jgi:hypothetical protein
MDETQQNHENKPSEKTQQIINKDKIVTYLTLRKLAKGGEADRFLDACATTCQNRRFFKLLADMMALA